MTFDLEYNSERPLMIIPEYGRHIQKLVDHCLALETKEERDKMAKSIVDVMGNLQPHYVMFQILSTNFGINCILWQILN